jgi:hypothetical protein
MISFKTICFGKIASYSTLFEQKRAFSGLRFRKI